MKQASDVTADSILRDAVNFKENERNNVLFVILYANIAISFLGLT